MAVELQKRPLSSVEEKGGEFYLKRDGFSDSRGPFATADEAVAVADSLGLGAGLVVGDSAAQDKLRSGLEALHKKYPTSMDQANGDFKRERDKLMLEFRQAENSARGDAESAMADATDWTPVKGLTVWRVRFWVKWSRAAIRDYEIAAPNETTAKGECLRQLKKDYGRQADEEGAVKIEKVTDTKKPVPKFAFDTYRYAAFEGGQWSSFAATAERKLEEERRTGRKDSAEADAEYSAQALALQLRIVESDINSGMRAGTSTKALEKKYNGLVADLAAAKVREARGDADMTIDEEIAYCQKRLTGRGMTPSMKTELYNRLDRLKAKKSARGDSTNCSVDDLLNLADSMNAKADAACTSKLSVN